MTIQNREKTQIASKKTTKCGNSVRLVNSGEEWVLEFMKTSCLQEALSFGSHIHVKFEKEKLIWMNLESWIMAPQGKQERFLLPGILQISRSVVQLDEK